MKELIQLIIQQFDEQVVITEDTIVTEVPEFDSLTAFSIIDSINEQYGVELDEKMLNLTVSQLYEKVSN